MNFVKGQNCWNAEILYIWLGSILFLFLGWAFIYHRAALSLTGFPELSSADCEVVRSVSLPSVTLSETDTAPAEEQGCKIYKKFIVIGKMAWRCAIFISQLKDECLLDHVTVIHSLHVTSDGEEKYCLLKLWQMSGQTSDTGLPEGF